MERAKDSRTADRTVCSREACTTPCQDQAGHRHLQVTECQTDRTIGLPVDSDSMSVLGGGLCGEGGDEPQHPALLGTGELANVIVSGVVMFE